MDFQTLVKTIISVIVAAIVVMAMAVPIISSMTEQTEQLTPISGALCRAQKIDTTSSTLAITQSADDSGVMTINGVEINVGVGGAFALIGYPTTVFFTPIETSEGYLYSWAVINFNNGQIRATVPDTGKGIDIADGVLSIGSDTFSTEWLILPSEGGDLGAVKDRSEYAGGSCYWAKQPTLKSLYKMDDPPNAAICWGDPTRLAEMIDYYWDNGGNLVKNGTPVMVDYSDGMVGITAYGLTDAIMDLAYVPYYISEKSEKSTTDSMIDLIPLLMIVGLIIAVVAAYTQYRREV